MTHSPTPKRPWPVSSHKRSFFEISPPRPWKPGSPLPNITDMASFSRVHRQRDDKLKEYLQYPHSNYRHLPVDLWSELLNRNASHLHCCNSEARITFAKIIQAQIAEFDIAALPPHQWITVCPAQFVVPLSEAHDFDPRTLMSFVRQALGDVPAIGLVEAGCYRRWGPHGPSSEDHVSWHMHFVTWGRSRSQLQPFATEMAKYNNMRGRSCVWICPIKPFQVSGKLLYASKGQIKYYRILQLPDEIIDPDTGVITVETHQTKDWMRTGEHVRMISALRDHRLDRLLFGNGDGTQLARAIRYEALKPFCAWAGRQNLSAEIAGRAVPYPEARSHHAMGVRLKREIGYAL